ncbi:MAG: hypothetical protein Q9187_001653 [Circinaria calcarea]
MIVVKASQDRTVRADRQSHGDQLQTGSSAQGEWFLGRFAPWILRNLTTREFVTAQAIALKPEYIRGPFIQGLGFGEVILSRIYRSNGHFVPVTERGGYCRDVWAGHRLDIVPFDSLNDNGSWKDVSNEVAKEIAKIWKSEYGEGWRNEVVSQKSQSVHRCPE